MKESIACRKCGSDKTTKDGKRPSGSQRIICHADGCPSRGKPFVAEPKEAGRKKSPNPKKRTTVSLPPEIWALAERLGKTRGLGIEVMAEFWIKKHQ